MQMNSETENLNMYVQSCLILRCKTFWCQKFLIWLLPINLSNSFCKVNSFQGSLFQI